MLRRDEGERALRRRADVPCVVAAGDGAHGLAHRDRDHVDAREIDGVVRARAKSVLDGAKGERRGRGLGAKGLLGQVRVGVVVIVEADGEQRARAADGCGAVRQATAVQRCRQACAGLAKEADDGQPF